MKRRSPGAAFGMVGLSLVLLGSFGGCVGPDTDDSETHFLIFCDGACPGDLECLCGVCTRPCTDASACPQVPGAVCEAACGESQKNVCDVQCARDHDCNSLGATFGCSDGRCRQAADGGGPRGSGGAPSAKDGGTGGAADGSAGDASRADASAGAESGTGRDASVRSACRAEPSATPTMPAPGTLDADLVARAGAVFGSCWQDDGVARFTEDMVLGSFSSARLWFRTVTQLQCLANASCGCSAVEHCLGMTRAFATGEDCETTCTGNVWRSCGENFVGGIDCGKFGLRCDVNAICVEEDPVPCDAATFVRACTPDGRATDCNGGNVWSSPPCESMGLVCRDGACVGGGGACSESFPYFDASPVGLRCLPDGVTLDACWGGGLTQIDCSTRGAGFTCQKPPGGRPFCGVAADCAPPSVGQSYRTTCDGDVLQFCNAGRVERVDCKSLGFVGCDVNTDVGRYGCIDAYQCGNGVKDPGEQCDDGNEDFLDGCAICMWSCALDEDCQWPGLDPCQEYACQDHRCIPSGPRPDGTPCSRETDTTRDDGACTAGACEFPETCQGTLYGQIYYSTCRDVDSNSCNGVLVCASTSAPRGSCTASSLPLRAGAPCGPGFVVCDTSHRCVPSKCGDGVIDADTGETCDPPDQGTCKYDCTRGP